MEEREMKKKYFKVNRPYSFDNKYLEAKDVKEAIKIVFDNQRELLNFEIQQELTYFKESYIKKLNEKLDIQHQTEMKFIFLFAIIFIILIVLGYFI